MFFVRGMGFTDSEFLLSGNVCAVIPEPSPESQRLLSLEDMCLSVWRIGSVIAKTHHLRAGLKRAVLPSVANTDDRR